MIECYTTKAQQSITPIIPVRKNNLETWLANQPIAYRNWIASSGFKPSREAFCLLPGADGALSAIVLGVDMDGDPWPFGVLPTRVPPGDYYLEAAGWSAEQRAQAVLGWGLGAYRFQGYKHAEQEVPRLVTHEDAVSRSAQAQVEATYLVRDLINTPAADMMPEHLAEAVQRMAKAHGAQLRQIVGDQLLAQGYPAIHAVGRASAHTPRLIDMNWGNAEHPKLTLIGKGVCFDSGGLNLKPASGMRLMKKDMGGAAHVLGLAQLIMAANLPVRLRVLVPAVENAVSGSAFRPGDVLCSRKGLTIEIDNTDAEGRLVLCDALAEAVGENPELVIDFATLTGAARIALGTELPAFFTNSDSLANALMKRANYANDPVWRLPLYEPYRALLDSEIADLLNSSPEPYGGAITAALFLEEFVPVTCDWAHFDVMAWNNRTRPGRPKGGEAVAMRAVFAYVRERFAAVS